MATTLLALGDYRFSVDTAAYRELTRVTEYRWPSQARLGRRPARQFMGVGEDTVTVRGVVYPHHRGGLGQLEAMRAQAGRGEPLRMVGGDGGVLGRWVITRIEETQLEHWPDGAPRRQDFVLELAHYGDDEGAEAGTAPVPALTTVRPTTSAAAAPGALQAAQAPIRELLGDADVPSAAQGLEAANAGASGALRDLLTTADLTSAAGALRNVAAVARAPVQDLVDAGADLAGATDDLRAVERPLRAVLDVADLAGAPSVPSAPALPTPAAAAAALATAASTLQAAETSLRAVRVLSGTDAIRALAGLGG